MIHSYVLTGLGTLTGSAAFFLGRLVWQFYRAERALWSLWLEGDQTNDEWKHGSMVLIALGVVWVFGLASVSVVSFCLAVLP